MSDSSPGSVPAGAFTRRTLLAAAVVGTAAVAAGCTSSSEEDAADAVTPAQVDQLAEQVAVQTALVAAYDRASATSPAVATEVSVLAAQARAQLERLQAAAPGPGAGAAASGPAPAEPVLPADPAGARAFLHAEVGRAAAAHAAACPDFTGARAALLGSIAAGLRGAEGQLA